MLHSKAEEKQDQQVRRHKMCKRKVVEHISDSTCICVFFFNMCFYGLFIALFIHNCFFFFLDFKFIFVHLFVRVICKCIFLLVDFTSYILTYLRVRLHVTLL